MSMEDKTRVLFVAPGREELLTGGIGKWTCNILGYYNSIIDSTDIELVHCVNRKSKQTWGVSGFVKRVKTGILNYLPVIKEAKEELKHSHFSVAHSCSSCSIGLFRDLIITHLAHKYGAKSVVHFHCGSIPYIMQSSGWQRKLLERLLHKVDWAIVMDGKSYEVLQNKGYTNVKYVPNPLSLETQKLIDEYGSVPRVPGKIVFVGQVLRTKGVMELADACRDIPNVQVEYVGHLPESEFAEALKEKTSTDKFIFRGAIPYPDVIQGMLSASIFVLPTYTEGFPNVIIESMACGCPIITCPVGAIPEMLNTESDEPCGICVPSQNVEKLREAIEYVLEHPSEAATMGERARQRVYAEYSVDKIWKELAEVWHS